MYNLPIYKYPKVNGVSIRMTYSPLGVIVADNILNVDENI